MRGETEFALFDLADLQHFGHVAVLQQRISGEIFSGLAETGLERRLAARSADAALGVADNPGFAVDDSRGEQRPDREIGGSRIAARIRNQPRAANAVPRIFRQTVDCLAEELGGGMLFLVPEFVTLGGAQPERAAEIHHDDAGFQKLRGKVHGNFGRGGQQNGFQAFGGNGFRTGRGAWNGRLAE